MSRPRPTLLLILDGWGQAPAGPGNAVSLARTPNLDKLLAERPTALLRCSGRAVGLPHGFMGNSEVGHMNIGAGRVVYQDMTRIDLAIEQGRFADNPVLVDLFARTKAAGGRLHLMGLVSDGGVHSHHNHIYALLESAKAHGIADVFVHCFLDGRDTPPDSGQHYVAALVAKMAEIGVGRVASLMGRYYAMDRDKRYERNEIAWQGLVLGKGEPVLEPVDAVRQAYTAGQTDEFVQPRILQDQGRPVGLLRDGDGVFFFNFRADRARQITRALCDPAFQEFERPGLPKLAGFATMTQYEQAFPLPAAFPPESITGTLGETVSRAGLKQLRIAETEKYAHVTYFLNCGREEPFPGEDRVLIPSPRDVATYDLKPGMSAELVTETLLSKWGEYDLAVCNLANLDMVGHTGIIPAVIQACETVDACVGRLVERVLSTGGRVLLTADHGNAEEMIDKNGGPQTAHSTNPVALVYVEEGAPGAQVAPGVLGDLAPTILELWGLPRPEAMTGTPLVTRGGQ
jgi:2,3-bisphosphoglycerate-independent phosphoglycerate mutase